MDGLRQYFVCDDDLEWSAYAAKAGGHGIITLTGNITCRGEIVIQVAKTLVVFADAREDDPYVQTDTYSYNAWVRGKHNFLRYDNAHMHRGHPDPHHRHRFDWRTGKQQAIEHVGELAWATLGDVIRLVEQWHADHRHELPEPDECAALDGLRAPDDPA